MSRSVTYTGPSLNGVDVVNPATPGELIHAPHGKPIDVPDALAKALADQDGWDTGTKTTKADPAASTEGNT